MNYAAAFHWMRKKADLSQRKLGERIGVTESFICFIERGKRMPSWETLDDAFRVCGIEPIEYFEAAYVLAGRGATP